MQSPDHDPLAAAYERGRKTRAILLEGALSQNQVAEKLEINSQEVDSYRENRKILAIPLKNGDYCYPKQQFHNDQLIEGLAGVLAAFKDLTPITQLSFLTTGDVRLNNRTPLEYLKANKIDQVVWAASCYGHHSAA